MAWFRGRWVSWALLGAGLVTTGCAGVVGAGAAVVVVGAGVLSSTCYDRVSVTVTDKVTGTELCDAQVTFVERGGGVTKAESCYEAALSNGTYKMKVERRGLVPYVVPVVIDTGKSCKHAVQTLYVALDRPNMQTAPQHIAPPPAPVQAPVPAAAPAPEPVPAPTAPAAPPAAVPATSFPPEAPPPAPSVAPAPAPTSGTFPAAP